MYTENQTKVGQKEESISHRKSQRQKEKESNQGNKQKQNEGHYGKQQGKTVTRGINRRRKTSMTRGTRWRLEEKENSNQEKEEEEERKEK